MTAITIETRPDLANLIALCNLMGETLTESKLAEIEASVAVDNARIARAQAAEVAHLERVRADKRNSVQLGCYLRHR